MKNGITRVNFSEATLTSIENGVKARLNVSLRDGYPRLTMVLDDKDGENTPILKRMLFIRHTASTMILLLANIKAVATGQINDYNMASIGFEYKNGEKTDNKVVEGTLHIQRIDGVVSLTAEGGGIEPVVFQFTLNNEWHKSKTNGVLDTSDSSRLSTMMAVAYADSVTDLINGLIIHKAITHLVSTEK